MYVFTMYIMYIMYSIPFSPCGLLVYWTYLYLFIIISYIYISYIYTYNIYIYVRSINDALILTNQVAKGTYFLVDLHPLW